MAQNFIAISLDEQLTDLILKPNVLGLFDSRDVTIIYWRVLRIKSLVGEFYYYGSIFIEG